MSSTVANVQSGNNTSVSGNKNNTAVSGDSNNTAVSGNDNNTSVSSDMSSSSIFKGCNNTAIFGSGNNTSIFGSGNNTAVSGNGNNTSVVGGSCSPVGANSEFTISGDPHDALSVDGKQVGEVDNQQTGNIDEIEGNNFGLSVNQQPSSWNPNVDVVTSTNMNLGGTQATFGDDGSLSLNGQPEDMTDGQQLDVNGNEITRSGNNYDVQNSQYDIGIDNCGSNRNVDIKTSADGIDPDTTGEAAQCIEDGNMSSMQQMAGSDNSIGNNHLLSYNLGSDTYAPTYSQSFWG